MPYRKTPDRIRHAEAVRDSIIDAAVNIVRTRGVEALTVRTIVGAAGSSIGNYYHHFGDKEALLAAVADRLANRVAERVDAAASAQSTVRAKLHAMVRVGVVAALEDPAVSGVIFASGGGNRVRETIRRRFIDRTAEFFRRFPAGVALEHDAELVAALWQGPILLLIERTVSGEFALEPEEAAKVCADWNIRALGL